MVVATVNNAGDLVLTSPVFERESDDDVGELTELMESYWTNGEYRPFDAGGGNPFVGLTNAPCIAEKIDIHDDGECEVVGRLWYFEAYMIESFMDTLATTGKVVFTLSK